MFASWVVLEETMSDEIQGQPFPEQNDSWFPYALCEHERQDPLSYEEQHDTKIAILWRF